MCELRVCLAEMNKRGNSINNKNARSGESARVFKLGEPIAEFRPLQDNVSRKSALAHLTQVLPIRVKKGVDKVIRAGRQRGV